ncbi:MAG: S-adenosylmethionine:tRNA ribosyltransferase-isomerase [Paludibacteraceae bacterium]|nr:S-adenosylmethionine:tRNA ribosyltransferase-isomerase [Paludibacteraceae bacterium]
MTVKQINISDYNYNLPDERIAKFPLEKRDSSKLLTYVSGNVSTNVFSSLPEILPANSCLVFNNTRVIQARLEFFKSTGSRIEIFCLEPQEPSSYELSLSSTQSCVWKCMIGNLKKWKGEVLKKEVGADNLVLEAERLETNGNTSYIKFSWNNGVSFAEVLDLLGELPIPPYLNRKTQESDKTTYQTVYSKVKGSVAAPTAGLHFTPEVISALHTKGIKTMELTLHVGAGTFQPVKAEEIGGHAMHAEKIEVSKEFIQNLIENLGNIVAVGTTSVRTLESLYYLGVQLHNGDTSLLVNQWEPYESEKVLSAREALEAILNYMEKTQSNILYATTQIMIVPGYKFNIVNVLITNFHQPKSTLLLLLAAFVGEKWRELYEYALNNDYRFLSYGDSSVLIP